MARLRLFEIVTPPHSYDVAITPEIERALADHAPVAIGVSDGKDSSAVAIRTFEYLVIAAIADRVLSFIAILAKSSGWKMFKKECCKSWSWLEARPLLVRQARYTLARRVRSSRWQGYAWQATVRTFVRTVPLSHAKRRFTVLIQILRSQSVTLFASHELAAKSDS